jgi:hypothetical protein
MTTNLQNNVFMNSMNVLNSLSFYSPLIVLVSILFFSFLSVTIEKAFVFFIWIFLITFVRIIFFKYIPAQQIEIPQICLTGLTEIFIPKDVTYSTYILSFTLMYFLLPMILVSAQSKVNIINYGILAFFIAYIALDLFIKSSLSCFKSIFSGLVLGDIVSGLLLGSGVAVLMYSTVLKPYLYINEINPNKEVCDMPSQQQFRCSVYKNGELVGSSIN